MTHAPRTRFVDFLKPGDLVVANDAATLPASLHGVHLPSGARIEVRLAGWHIRGSSPRTCTCSGPSSSGQGTSACEPRIDHCRLCWRLAIILCWAPDKGTGEGLSATIEERLDHPRLVLLRFEGSTAAVWEGLARYGRPIQYAHVQVPLAMWDIWTPIAGVPAAFEPPSASFVLDWGTIRAMRERDIAFATVTLAAGISSTGDPDLDRRLPLDEPYRISESAASAIRRARATGGRIVAIGTTVVRALEHAGASAVS